jgi:hypothetical protein
MGERQWQPGDVAMVTVDYGRATDVAREVVCFRTAGWWRDAKTGASYGSALREVKDARPLVVIDPEDREQVERLAVLFLGKLSTYVNTADIKAMQAALREFANPKPPKPDEPTGLGAVVRLSRPMMADPDGGVVVNVLVRHNDGLWWAEGGWGGWKWDDVPAAKVLSEGVQP